MRDLIIGIKFLFNLPVYQYFIVVFISVMFTTIFCAAIKILEDK